MFSTRAFNSDNIIAIATMDYQAGRFAEAERGCRAVLKVVPDDASALYLLGLTEVQAGSVEAVVSISATGHPWLVFASPSPGTF
ncbi:MAG TPA: hypothetical protein VIJ04_14650 [Xanthobacteraceae bacterium]